MTPRLASVVVRQWAYLARRGVWDRNAALDHHDDRHRLMYGTSAPGLLARHLSAIDAPELTDPWGDRSLLTRRRYR